MPGCLKVGLIVLACLFVLGGGCVAVGIWFWHRNGQEIVATGHRELQQGALAGKEMDEQGCVDAARARANGGLKETLGATFFLRGCLSASRETPALCEGVPAKDEFRASIDWTMKQCSDDPGNTSCQQVMSVVQEFCALGKPKIGGPRVPGWILPDDLGAADSTAAPPLPGDTVTPESTAPSPAAR
jgi:hypothetical protein